MENILHGHMFGLLCICTIYMIFIPKEEIYHANDQRRND